jgi:YD repeat-containing protein
VGQVTDPMGNVTQTSYDDAGRTTQTIEAYGTSSARTTNYSYTLDNLIATMTAVNSTTGDQTTFWLYGTTLTDSGVARNDLLRLTAYPTATPGWSSLTVDDWANLTVDQWAALTADPTGDVTSVTYNRLGQRTTFTDQRGTVRTLYYDLLGRQTNDCVTTVGSNTDNAVLQIARAYEIRGMVSTITSYDNATVGSGTVVNQVQLTYNTFGQLIEDDQSHSGAVTSGAPSVQYAFATGTANQIRPVNITYPDGHPHHLSPAERMVGPLGWYQRHVQWN